MASPEQRCLWEHFRSKPEQILNIVYILLCRLRLKASVSWASSLREGQEAHLVPGESLGTAGWFFQKWPSDCQNRWLSVLASNGWQGDWVSRIFPEFPWVRSVTRPSPLPPTNLGFLQANLLRLHTGLHGLLRCHRQLVCFSNTRTARRQCTPQDSP